MENDNSNENGYLNNDQGGDFSGNNSNNGSNDGWNDGFTQSTTTQNTQQNLYQMQSQSTEEACGFAIAGMVLGILSIVCCCAWYISVIMAILGLIFSILTIVQHRPGRSLAIAGIICSSIGIVIALVSFVAIIAFNQSSVNYNELMDLLDSLD